MDSRERQKEDNYGSQEKSHKEDEIGIRKRQKGTIVCAHHSTAPSSIVVEVELLLFEGLLSDEVHTVAEQSCECTMFRGVSLGE